MVVSSLAKFDCNYKSTDKRAGFIQTFFSSKINVRVLSVLWVYGSTARQFLQAFLGESLILEYSDCP